MSLTYSKCEELMRSARNREKGKPLKHNTRLFDLGDCFGVQHYYTIVLKIYPDGTKQIDTDRWYTQTTKDRINDYGGLRIWAQRGRWWSRATTGVYKEVRSGDRFNTLGCVIDDRDVLILTAAEILVGDEKKPLSQWSDQTKFWGYVDKKYDEIKRVGLDSVAERVRLLALDQRMAA